MGVEIQAQHILGTTHFFRGGPIPENELVGVIYLCTLLDPASIRISPEHSEYRWLSADEAIELLTAADPATQWINRVIQRAENIRTMLPEKMIEYQSKSGFELG